MRNNPEKHLLLAARVLTVGIPLFLVVGRAAADVALTLVALLFLAHSIITKDWAWAQIAWVRIALALWLWMLLISNFAFDVSLSYSQAIPWIRFILFAIALEVWVLNATWIRRLVISAAVMVALVAVDAWWQYFTGVDFLGHQRPSEPRLTGPFNDQRVGIYLTKLLFPALLGFAGWWAWKRGAFGSKLLLAGITLMVIGAIFVSGERMAFLLVVFGLFLTVVLQKDALRAAVAGMFIVSVVGTGVLALADRTMMTRQFTSVTQTVATFYDSDYGQLWRSALQLGSERLFTGVGMKNFRVACSNEEVGLPPEVEERCSTHPHNFYMEWFAESGLPGLMLFVLMLVALATRLWQAWRVAGQGRAWMAGPVIAVIIQLWPIATTASFFSNWSGALVWLAVGWALAAAKVRDA